MSNIPKLRFPEFTDAWEKCKLGEAANIIMGQSPSSKFYTDNPKDYILVQGNADLKNGWVMPRVWTTQRTKVGKKGDLIFSVRAPVGEIGKTSYDVVLGRGVAAIQGNEFIFQTLSKMNIFGFWKTLSTGSTFDAINSNELRKVEINIPTLPEQQKIGNLFKQLDRLITLHKRKWDDVILLKKALLQKMFPKNGSDFPEIRFPEFTDAWEKCKLGDVIIDEIKGKAKADMLGEQSLYLDANYLNGGNELYVNSPTDVDKNDVIILWDGSQAGTVYHGFSGALGSTFKAFRPKQSGAFLYQQLKRYQDTIYNSYRTPNIPHVIKSFTKEFNISIPNYEEQQKIGNLFKQLDRLITLHKRQHEHYQLLKKALLQQMFV